MSDYDIEPKEFSASSRHEPNKLRVDFGYLLEDAEHYDHIDLPLHCPGIYKVDPEVAEHGYVIGHVSHYYDELIQGIPKRITLRNERAFRQRANYFKIVLGEAIVRTAVELSYSKTDTTVFGVISPGEQRRLRAHFNYQLSLGGELGSGGEDEPHT